MILSVELYREDDRYGIYIADNKGGSGIEVEGDSPEDVANQAAPYLADYFYENEDEE